MIKNSISIKQKNMPPTEAPPMLWHNNQLLLHHNYAHFATTTRSCPIPAAVQHATLPQPNACAQCLYAVHHVDCTQCACEVMPNACCPTITRWCPVLAAHSSTTRHLLHASCIASAIYPIMLCLSLCTHWSQHSINQHSPFPLPLTWRQLCNKWGHGWLCIQWTQLHTRVI